MAYGMLTSALLGAGTGLVKFGMDKVARSMEEEAKVKAEAEREARIEEAAIRTESRKNLRSDYEYDRKAADETITKAEERQAKSDEEQRKIREANDPKNLSAQKTEAEIAKIKADTGLSEKRAEHVGKGGRDNGDDDATPEGGMRKKDLIRMEGVDENGHKVVYWKNIKTDKIIKDEPVITKADAKAADKEAVRKANEATGSKYANAQEVVGAEEPSSSWIGNKTKGMLGTSDEEAKAEAKVEKLKREKWLMIYGNSLTKKPAPNKSQFTLESVTGE
jgi:hypothetical protein